MIHDIYFSYAQQEREGTKSGQHLADCITNAPDEDYFIFILDPTQIDRFNEFIKSFNLSTFIKYRMKRPVTNLTYPNSGRRLTLIIMGRKEIVNAEYTATTNICGKV